MHTLNRFPDRQPDRPPLLIGSVWMAGIALVLSLVPIVGGLTGGFVGGWLLGSPRRALGGSAIAVVLYALLLPFIPYAGVFRTTPTGAGETIALAAAALLLAAVLGGALARSRKRPTRLA